MHHDTAKPFVQNVSTSDRRGWRSNLFLNKRNFFLVAFLALSVGAVYFEALKFALIGITGAVFANATGAGGGVVFIPLFTQLGFSEGQTVSTSFGIQCFGMTAGALTWSHFYLKHHRNFSDTWQSFLPIITLCAFFSIAGIWTNYALSLEAFASLHQIFKLFSIILGLCILVTVVSLNNKVVHHRLQTIDALVLIPIAFFGGLITGWLSVAVGEFVAFYLIFRRYDVTLSVASAVVITAFTVWSVAPIHLSTTSEINWQVLAFAGPGAAFGGVLAKTLVNSLSPKKLKLFFAAWLLIIGIVA